jgi:hypothetical protein
MPGSDLMMGMYTGHFGAGYEYPSLVATWQHTGPDLSVFVHRGDQRSASISLYNFGAAKSILLKTWQLEPGIYILRQAPDRNDDGIPDEAGTEQKIELKERVNAIGLTIPSKKETLLTITQLKSYGPADADLADAALSADDIRFPDTAMAAGQLSRIQCKIHNIGSRAAENLIIECSVDHKKTGQRTIPVLEAPNDLKPRWTTVDFMWKALPGEHRIGIKIISAQREITKQNNEAESVVRVR